MKKKIWLLLGFLIVAISLYLRVSWLEISPNSAGFDEAALGYNTYSLLKTGKDEHGRSWPISLASFNDYKPALYAYLSLLPVKILGLSQTSTRLVSALAGTVILLFTGLIGWIFFKRQLWLGLLVLLVAALQPWGLHYSRTAFEANLATAFFTIGVWAALREKKGLAAVFLALSMHSYHSPRVAAPLFFLLYLLIEAREKKNLKLSLSGLRKTFWPGIFLIFLTLPIWVEMREGSTLTRLRQTGAWQRLYPYSPPELINLENIWGSFPANPVYYLTGQLWGHFFAYFSPINFGFRIFHWVRNSPQNIAGFSMIGWGESLFLIWGLILLLKNWQKKESKIFLAWIGAGVVPAVVTWTWFHPLRSLTIYPAVIILIVWGMVDLFQRLKTPVKILVLIFLVPLFLMQGAYVVNNELVYNVYESHGEYQPGGFKEGVGALAEIQADYEQVILETPHAQGYIFFLFYQSFPPERLQEYASFRKLPGTEGDLSFDFDKYQFRDIYWPEDRKLKKTLFWGSYLSLNKEDVLKEENVKIYQEFKNILGNTAAVMVATE